MDSQSRESGHNQHAENTANCRWDDDKGDHERQQHDKEGPWRIPHEPIGDKHGAAEEDEPPT